MDKIDLPGGAWAQLRDPDTITERQRRPIKAAMIAAGSSGEFQAALADGIFDHLVLALLESWSFDAPVTAEGLLDLPGSAYDALTKACTPMLKQILPDFAPTPDPESPSAPSNA